MRVRPKSGSARHVWLQSISNIIKLHRGSTCPMQKTQDNSSMYCVVHRASMHLPSSRKSWILAPNHQTANSTEGETRCLSVNSLTLRGLATGVCRAKMWRSEFRLGCSRLADQYLFHMASLPCVGKGRLGCRAECATRIRRLRAAFRCSCFCARSRCARFRMVQYVPRQA